MRILVYGAGVLGCNLARNLFRAGKNVTLLARGTWAEQLRANGLRIKDKFSPRVSVSRISVVTELSPDDLYDVIFVVMRCTQLDAIMDTPVSYTHLDVYKRQVRRSAHYVPDDFVGG